MAARRLTAIILLAALAGCAEPPVAAPASESSPVQTPDDRFAAMPPHQVCDESAATVGVGEAFVECEAVDLWRGNGTPEAPMEQYRSGRVVMDWTAVGMVEAYLEFEAGNEPIASARSGSSPIVLEFELPPTFASSGAARFGGTGLAAPMDAIVTVDLWDPRAPEPMLHD